MPRAQVSPAASILRFFRTAELREADLVLGLVKDTMRERTQRSTAAKARATGVQEAPAPPPAAGKKKAGRKRAKKRVASAAAATAGPALPLDTLSEAGDAPPV